MAFGRTRIAPSCPCRCGTQHGFCPDHTAKLAAIRVDFEAKRAINTLKGHRARSKHRPMCCISGCSQDRLSGNTYCWEHENEHAD